MGEGQLSYVRQVMIREAYREIDEQLAEARKALIALQAECQHPLARMLAGDFDYHICPDCGKRWCEGQSA